MPEDQISSPQIENHHHGLTDFLKESTTPSTMTKTRAVLVMISIGFVTILLLTDITSPIINSRFVTSWENSSPFQRYRPSFDIVLSYYNENTAFVARFIRYLRNVTIIQKRPHRFIVYNKNQNIKDEQLKQVLNVDTVKTLPNLGREGATFLSHIIDNYDQLANHILFTQAGVEGITDTGLADWFQDRLERQFNDQVGYMPLVVNSMISTYDCGIHPSGNFPRLPEFWAMLEQTVCPLGGQAVAFRGQFLVSRRSIRRRSLRIYQYLFDLITAKGDHWIHKDPRMPRARSTPDNPIFGHVVERLWTILFNCSKPDLADRCRRNNCTCFD